MNKKTIFLSIILSVFSGVVYSMHSKIPNQYRTPSQPTQKNLEQTPTDQPTIKKQPRTPKKRKSVEDDGVSKILLFDDQD